MTQRYLRSINIAHDLTQTGSELQGYIATPLVLQTLDRIIRGVNDAAHGRAYSIIGPYGTGKSAFGVFLAHWFSADPDSRTTLLLTHSAAREVGVDVGSLTLLAVPVSAKSVNLRQGVLTALMERLAIHGQQNFDAEFMRELQRAATDVDVAPDRVAELVQQACQVVRTSAKYRGILLLVDELGQHLSQIHRSADTRDLFTLQTIAEAAARTSTAPLVIVTILHQTFERYSTTGSVSQQTEWAKVQGRYIDLVFQEPIAQMLRFVSRVLAESPKPKQWKKYATRLADESVTLELKPNEIDIHEWRSLVHDSYPLHPVVLVALPYLFRSIAQNERSLFAFLTANERGGLQERIGNTDGIDLYRISDLYAYVENTLGPGLFGRAKGRPWVEVSELLKNSKDFPNQQLNILTTVGTLGALNEERALKATKHIVAFAISDDASSLYVATGIRSLIEARHLLFSTFRNRIRLAEASDINLDEKFYIARNEVSAEGDLVSLLKQNVDLLPIIAHEHSYRTGTVRSFVPQFIPAAEILGNPTAVSMVEHDVLWYVVVLDDEERQKVLETVIKDIVYVIPERTSLLRDLLLDSAAHKKLQSDAEINADKVAKRELNIRVSESENALRAQIEHLYGKEHGIWVFNGRHTHVADARALDAALSAFLDVKYASAPYIRNELIVRRKISGTISRARRVLIELLLDSTDTRLFTGDLYPPERAIYESIFIAGNLHTEVVSGEWALNLPENGNDKLHLLPLFNEMYRFLESTEQKKRPLTELYAVLSRAPFGVREPLLPLFFVTVYLMRSGELAIYEHESYVAAPDIALFERLLAKPAYFSIRLTPSSTLRTALFERIAHAFAPHALDKKGTPALLDAVKPMLKFAAQLPSYVKTTAKLSAATKQVLDALLSTKAPDELLYQQLPLAVGMEPVGSAGLLEELYVEQFAKKLRNALEEMQNAYTMLYKQCVQEFATAVVAVTSDSELLHAELKTRMQLVLDQSEDRQLRTLATRVLSAEPKNWMEPVAALLGKKPLGAWNDTDVGVFQIATVEIGRRLRLFEQVATSQHTELLGVHRRRLGVANQSGERSIVVEVIHNEKLQEIQRTMQDLLAASGLGDAEKLSVLAMILEDALPREEIE